VRRKTTLIGPHRDDVRLAIDGRPLDAFGSQGQQRTAVLALKVAEYETMRARAGRCSDTSLGRRALRARRRTGGRISICGRPVRTGVSHRDRSAGPFPDAALFRIAAATISPWLTKLGTALGGWRPSGGPPGDPLATIRAAWADIVGDDVARAPRNRFALTGSALVVVTASGAWTISSRFSSARSCAASSLWASRASSVCVSASETIRAARAVGGGGSCDRCRARPRAGSHTQRRKQWRVFSRRGRTAAQRASRRRRCILRELRRSDCGRPLDLARSGCLPPVCRRAGARRTRTVRAHLVRSAVARPETVINVRPRPGCRRLRSHSPAAASRLG